MTVLYCVLNLIKQTGVHNTQVVRYSGDVATYICATTYNALISVHNKSFTC